MRLTFQYASAKSRDKIEAILADAYATGDVFESEVAGIKKIGNRWVLLLWG